MIVGSWVNPEGTSGRMDASGGPPPTRQDVKRSIPMEGGQGPGAGAAASLELALVAPHPKIDDGDIVKASHDSTRRSPCVAPLLHSSQ